MVDIANLIDGAISIALPVISIISIIIVVQREANISQSKSFHQIYTRTFELRQNISKKFIQKTYGQDFYYELDLIRENDDVQEYVLDYLTEVNNFFQHSRRILARKTLKDLVYPAFYHRLLMIYPYVLSKRINDSSLFKNYIGGVEILSKKKKFKKMYMQPKNHYYIGIRDSDIQYSLNRFAGSVCLFSDKDSGPFPVRPNQNIYNKLTVIHISGGINNILEHDDNAKFVFYNQNKAYQYPKDVLSHVICLNKRDLLEFINNKLNLKLWLEKNNINVIPFETYFGHEISYENLHSKWGGEEAFVIQTVHGGGGIGTFVVTKESMSEIHPQLSPLETYIVSPYIKNGISVNTHIFISDKQNVISPGSIQITELHDHQIRYVGADYITFRTLPFEVREDIKRISLKIANMLREREYKGVAGIDFLIDGKGNVFCTEINPRFQASTILIDKYLSKTVDDKLLATSTFQLNEMAFNGCMVTNLSFEDKIDYSCYYYYKYDLDFNLFEEKMMQFFNNNVELHLDGLFHPDGRKFDENSYMFRAIFSHPICGLSPDMTLWINNNIKIEKQPEDTFSLKVALLNQGVRLSDRLHTHVKKGVYESVDIVINKFQDVDVNLDVNCAYGIHLSQYSPYFIDILPNNEDANIQGILYYFSTRIATVTIEEDQLTMLSEMERKILYLATDRLRIKLLDGCDEKNRGKGCSFCNLPPANVRYSIDDIKNALSSLEKMTVKYEHILIGGGTCLDPDVWDMIVDTASFLKNDELYKNKSISLMSIPPPARAMNLLKRAGVDEVAFNLEVSNEMQGCVTMPGKRMAGKNRYYDAFKAAVKIFGIGNVRTTLVVGLDTEADLRAEVERLLNMDVVPCLSALRMLPNTEFEYLIGPDNEYLIGIYNMVSDIITSSNSKITSLGPKCRRCRNNMLHK